MKKKLFMILLSIAVITACTACGSTNNKPSSVSELSSEKGTEEVEISEEDRTLIYDTMQTIYDVGPGSAGSSNRMMIAAGKLLDLSEALTDQFNPSALASAAFDWAQENDQIEGIFDQAYLDVRETALDYLDDPEKYETDLQDCGYEFAYPEHAKENLDFVLNYIEISRATGE